MKDDSLESVRKEYDVNEIGIITSPGKFEGDPWWNVVVYDWMLDGLADTTLGRYDIFSAPFPAEWEVSSPYLAAFEDDNGFFYVEELSNENFDALIDDVEAEESEDF